MSCADLDGHVLQNLTSLTHTELRDGYHRCSNLTTLSQPFDELLRGCEGDSVNISDCVMKAWLHQWLCHSPEGSSSGCWEDVILLLQCLDQKHMLEHISTYVRNH